MSLLNTVKLKSNGRIGYLLPSLVLEGGVQPYPTDYRRVVFPIERPGRKATTQRAVIQIVHHTKLEAVKPE